MVELLNAQVAQTLHLALQGPYGFWTPLVDLLKGLVLAAGGVGIVVGLAVKATAAGNQDRQALGNRLIEGAIAGLFVGLLAVAIYELMEAWIP